MSDLSDADLLETYRELRTKLEVTLDADRRKEVWAELKPVYDEMLRLHPDAVEPLPPSLTE